MLVEDCHNNGDTPPVGNFGRIFPDLPPFATPNVPLTLALLDFGAPGGYLDAKDDLSDAELLITDPSRSLFNPDNPTQTAGQTFFGQFVGKFSCCCQDSPPSDAYVINLPNLDHDLTFDLTSRLGVPKCPADAHNARTPRFDLDTVYGTDFYLGYDSTLIRNDSKFYIESGGVFEDLPRNARTLAAIIPDPRNDENLMISGLHAALLKFHNNIIDYVVSTNLTPTQSQKEAEWDRQFFPTAPSSTSLITRARRLVTWHYQWIVVHEHLVKILGLQLVNDILRNGPRFFKPTEPFIPVEFQGACYRFGHSQVRPSYRANLHGNNITSAEVNLGADGFPAFFAITFDNEFNGQSDPTISAEAIALPAGSLIGKPSSSSTTLQARPK